MNGYQQNQKSSGVKLILEPATKLIYLLIIIVRFPINPLIKSGTFFTIVGSVKSRNKLYIFIYDLHSLHNNLIVIEK